MLLVFRLPLILAETFLRQGLAAAEAVIRLVRGRTDADRVVPTEPAARYAGDRSSPNGGGAAVAEPAPSRRPPLSGEEAIARRRAREEAARPAPTERPAPPQRPPATGRHVDREATVVESLGPADEPHATLRVEAPWAGYDEMSAAAIVERCRGADEATKAVVRLYEQNHKRRRTVLAATGG
jgi:hypothetical protein